MNFFDILRRHAQHRSDSVATASPRHRLTTYRQFWSRIERASSRLQGEWLVAPGDIVIYSGHAHPDALVLWLSLARLGAVFMPLESAGLQERADALVLRHDVRLLLHDDDLPAPLSGDFCACMMLSTLIARRCEFEAQDCPESTANISLSCPDPASLIAPPASFSLDALLEPSASDTAAALGADRRTILPGPPPLFDPQRLRQQILPALSQGLPLMLE